MLSSNLEQTTFAESLDALIARIDAGNSEAYKILSELAQERADNAAMENHEKTAKAA